MSNNNDNNNNNEEEQELHEAGSNRPACASCKHQRKKCIEGDCVMWRHFPASKMDEFLKVHKVFGISNVTKKIKSLEDVAQQDEAIKSFLWEARMWQEDPVHGPLGEYKKLEQQLKEEQRNKQLQIVELSKVPQLPPPPTTEPIRYLRPLAVDYNMVAAKGNNANNSIPGAQQNHNMLNSNAPNYANLLQWHGHGGEKTQGTTSNGQDLINVSGGNNNRFGFGNFPSHYNRPNGFIPRPTGLQGIGQHPTTNNNVGLQLHQQRYSYNNIDLGRGRRRNEQSDQFVSPSCFGRNVRGRGIGPIINTTTATSNSLAGPIIPHGPMISSCSSGPLVDSSTANANANATRTIIVRPSINGKHVEDGRNQRPEDLTAVLQDFTNYNHNDLPGEHKQRDLENMDDSTFKRF